MSRCDDCGIFSAGLKGFETEEVHLKLCYTCYTARNPLAERTTDNKDGAN